MSDLKDPSKAIMFMSCLYNENYESNLSELIKEHFGKYSSFHHSFFPMKDYYSKEMGANLKRVFLFFKVPIHMSSLVKIKIKT